MFLPDGCDCHIDVPTSSGIINSVTANKDRSLIVAATDNELHFYLSNTRLLASILQRDEEDIRERGFFEKVYWKPDSTSICVTTSNNYLNIYTVEISQTPSSFNLHDPAVNANEFSRESSELFLAQNRPQIEVKLSVVARLEAESTCILSFKEELIICLTDGWLHRLSWAGNVLPELSFNIRNLCGEHSHSTASKNLHQNSNIHIIDIAPFLGGICAVFHDGRAALLVSNTPKFKQDSITIFWAGGLNDACCCSTNFKFRIIYFGCKNGDIVAQAMDDVNGGLVQLFRIHLIVKNGTEYLDKLSSVRQIRCLIPQGNVFAVIWNKKPLEDKEHSLCNGEQENLSNSTKSCPPALAIFSPFGEQWWCSLEDSASSYPESNFLYTAMDWAVEGFQLWLGTINAGIQVLNLAKSIPFLHNQLLMVGSDRIYTCPADSVDIDQMPTTAPHLIWQIFKPPHNYITSNGPIKHIATNGASDFDGIIAIGGSHGFCFYNIKTNKWRMFRKEAEEKSLLLTGGLVIFQSFILASCCNVEMDNDDADRLYAFRMDEQLDLDRAHYTLTNRILEMKLSGSHLLTFDVNSIINISSILSPENQKTQLEMDCIAEIRIAEFLPHPNCLVSMELAKLNFYSDALPFCDDMDSLLINVSGHLLLLCPMRPQTNGQKRGNNSQEEVTEFQLHPPTLVASNVEQFWVVHAPDETMATIPFLSEAIWINAGCKKSRIWLPLSSEMPSKGSTDQRTKPPQLVQQNSRTFISRRIMLPLEMGIYPICIDSNYLACTASCTSVQLKSAGGKHISAADDISLNSKFTEDDSLNEFVGISQCDSFSALHVHSLVRTNEVFIHKLLKQLLKRNLGSYAFELASACRPLSYFRHILELLLHDLLDEEATSSEPIPDPLLPTVVSFLREFPSDYLQTVVHCARKTELAFWNLLFSVSNHPRQLFQMCLQEGQLETATSCLVILHSLITIYESSKLAFQLLEEALNKRRWGVAQDIVRFMQNINRATERDSMDAGSSPESPVQGKLAPLLPHYHPPSFNSSNDEFNFPLFSSQIDIESTAAPSLLQQRRRSGSGKDQNTQKHITSFTGIRKQPPKPATSPPPAKEKSPNATNNKKSPPVPLAIKMPPQKGAADEKFDGQKRDGNLHYACLDEILTKHAYNLLEDYALRDLGAFSSYLPFDLVAFFRRPENAFSLSSAEFPLVLMKLHAQFNWPYPVTLLAPLMTPSKEKSNGHTIEPPSTPVSLSATSAFFLSNQNEANGVQLVESTVGVISNLSNWRDVRHQFSDKLKPEKGTAQAEAELLYIFDQLRKAEAWEWLYILTILRRDIHAFNEQVLEQMRQLALDQREKRIETFLSNVRGGTKELYDWAQTKCTSYLPVISVFNDFLKCDK